MREGMRGKEKLAVQNFKQVFQFLKPHRKMERFYSAFFIHWFLQRRNRGVCINLFFHSAHCASFIKTGEKLKRAEGGRGGYISLVGKEPINLITRHIYSKLLNYLLVTSFRTCSRKASLSHWKDLSRDGRWMDLQKRRS